MSDLHSELQELRARVEQLERAPQQRRTNQAGAARYLGISEETLRQRHARGEGPPRKNTGSELHPRWVYDFRDLDSY